MVAAAAFFLSLLAVGRAETIESGPKTYSTGISRIPVVAVADTITTANSVVVPNGANVTYVAANQVRLEPGFSVTGGGSFTARVAAIPVPNGLNAVGIGSQSFVLQWNASPGEAAAAAYEVRRDGASLGTVGSNAMMIGGLTPASTYAFTVRVRDANGNWSDWSSSFGVTTLADTTPPSIPSGLSVSSLNGSSFTLDWNASSDTIGVTGYEIRLDGVSLGIFTGSNHALTGLLPNTRYAVQLRARDAAGNWSPWSETTTVVTPAGVFTFAGEGSYTYDDGGYGTYKNYTNLTGVALIVHSRYTRTFSNSAFGQNFSQDSQWTVQPNGGYSETYNFDTFSDHTEERIVSLVGVETFGIPALTCPTARTSALGVAETLALTANNTPTTFSATGLPPGLSMTTAGIVSGTPNAAGTYRVAITATNSYGTGSGILVWTVIVDNEAPTAPGAPYLSDLQNAPELTLNWSGSTDNMSVTAYEILKNGTAIGRYPGNTTSISFAYPNTDYVVTVRAKDSSGNWSAPSAPLTLHTMGLSIESGSANTIVALPGTKHQLTAAEPPVGKYFAGWSVTGPGSVDYPVMPTAIFTAGSSSATIKANYAEGYQVLVVDAANVPGRATLSSAGGTAGQTISIHAPPNPGGTVVFWGWKLEGPGMIESVTERDTTLILGPARTILTPTYREVVPRQIFSVCSPPANSDVNVAFTFSSQVYRFSPTILNGALRVDYSLDGGVTWTLGDAAHGTAWEGIAPMEGYWEQNPYFSMDTTMSFDRPNTIMFRTRGWSFDEPDVPGFFHYRKVQVSNAGTLSWVPVNVRVVDLESTTTRLVWDPAPGSPTDITYEVYLSGGGHDGSMGSTGTATSTNLVFLQPGTSYTFKVRARNWTESSAWSAPVTITSLLLPTMVNSTNTTGTVGSAFDFHLVATNQPTSFTVTGTLPPGLSFNSTTGVISGTPTSAGSWTLATSAMNRSGPGYGSLTIVIGILPTIQTHPVSQAVVAGQSITLSVAATGTPTPTYQWRKNGAAISGATNTTLAFTNITVADAGWYTAAVSNAGGTVVSYPGIVTVSTDAVPTITQQPSSARTVVGSGASFVVLASGLPAPTYQWKKNGVAISGATASTYSLTSATAGDAGDYTVTVTNSAGSVTSSLATLTVAAANTAPTIAWSQVPDGNTTLHPGDPFVIRAQGQDAEGNLSSVTIWRVVDGSDVVFASAGSGDGSISVTPMASATGTASGTITFKAKATDASNASSAVITQTVTIAAEEAAANIAPTISWSQGPATAATSETFTVQAHAEDANGNLTTVQIWRDGQTPEETGGGNGHDNLSKPISYSQGTGSVTFHAKAIDAAGAQSATIDLTVNITNAAPAAGSVRQPVAPGAGDLVATLPGSLSVDNKGTASYTISLPTPPGRAGLQPSLALSYNSGGGNGPVGLGWSISTGFPHAVTRGRTILARDGVVAGPSLGEHECRLYLDGRRLIQTTPGVASSYAFKDDYWKIGSTYRTEVDSFTELTSMSPDTVWVDGFTMTGKDGSVAKFGIVGSDNDAVDYAPNYNGVSRGSERAWAIKKISDTVGNEVVFAYTNYTNVAGKRTGEQQIESITYTANPGASVDAAVRIRFIYSPEDPEEKSVRPDHAKSSVQGGSELSRRLTKIEVDVRNDSGTWETMRRYGCVYEASPKNGLSRLRYVTSAWKDAPGGSWKSMPSTELTYKNDPSLLPVLPPVNQANAHGGGDRATAVTGDFNGDGKTDRFANGDVFLSDGDGFIDGQQWINLAAISGWVEFVKTGDFDGDGKTDIAWMNGNTIYAARSNGHGFEPLSSGGYVAVSGTVWFNTASISMPKGTLASRVSLGDFNGDGRTDILLHPANEYEGTRGVELNQQTAGPRGLYVALSHGNGFDAPTRWGQTNTADALYMKGDWANGNALDPRTWLEAASIEPIVADFNGDGADDYAWVCRRTFVDMTRTWMNSFSPPFNALDVSVQVVISRPWTPRKFTDPDQIHWQNNDGHNPQITAADYILSCIPADVNADGLPDLLVLGKNAPGASGTTSWILYRSNGFGQFDRVDAYMPIAETAEGTVIPTYNLNYEQTLDQTINEVWSSVPDVTESYYVWIKRPPEPTPTGTQNEPDLRELVFEGGYYVRLGQSYSVSEKEQSGGMFLVDLNHDGRPDYVWGIGDIWEANGWWVKYGTPDGFGPAQKLWNIEDLPFPGPSSPYTNMETREGGISLETIDIDGDGASDLLLTARHNDETYYGPVLAKVPGPHADRLASVKDGLGSETRVDYLTTANTAIYTPGVDVSYPIRERRGGQHVVSDVWRDSGGSTPAHFSYQYSGNRLDLSGRGALGFHSFVTFDEQTNLFKYQFLTQSFPMTGLTHREETYRYLGSGSFRFLSSHDNTVVFDEVVKSPTDSAPWGTVYPFISKAIESRWENSDTAQFSLGAAVQSSQSEALFPLDKPDGAHITITAESRFDQQTATQTALPGVFNASDVNGSGDNAVTGVNSYATIQGLALPRKISYGNLVQLSTDYGDGFTEKVVTEYKSPVGSLTGLVDNVQTSVESTGYGTQTAPVKRFTYFGSTPLVATETIDASGDQLDLKTTHTRDSLGRVTDTKITNTAATGVQAIGDYSIAKVDSFDSYFDLPTVAKNAEPYRHATTTTYHRFFAQPTSVTDVNGAQATTEYDALGRATKVTDVLKNLTSETTFAWTSASASDWKKTQTVSAPAGVDNAVTVTSSYAVHTTATMKPAATVYYDRLGRAIRAIKDGFGTQVAITDSVFDTLGRVVAVSLPYPTGGTVYWTKTTYDSVGRVSTVTAPNGTVTTTTYNGRATAVEVKAPVYNGTTIAAQTNTTLVNAKGQTIKVWNADNVPTFSDTKGTAATNAIPSIEFTLDGFGRMRTTKLKDQAQTIAAAYDDLGHQTSLNDPDKGAWSYVNNALGQVVQQNDANLNTTITAFDHLGRALSRATIEPSSGPTELADYFYYDTATTAAIDPALHLVPKGDKGWIGALQRTESSTSGAPGYAGSNSATANIHYFDAKGRPAIDLTTIDGKWFYTYSDYDTYSRLNQVRYHWLPGGAEDQTQTPSAWQDFGYTYSYDAKSYVLSMADTTASPRTWWQADSTAGYDYLDRPVLVRKGNGHWTQRTYRATDGVLTGIKTGTNPGDTTLQNLTFDFDGIGNLRQRTSSGTTENVTYDVLNRLTSGKQGTMTYAANGNILKKPKIDGTLPDNNFTYDGTHPHAVATAWTYNMTYDANGNMVTRDSSTTGSAAESWKLKYAGFDKPRWMTKTTGTTGPTTVGSEFLYDANRSRTVHLEYNQANATTGEPTHYVRKRVYGLGPTLEANYTNSASTGTPSWSLSKVRIYVPGPDGVIGAREFDNPTSSGGTEKPLVYHYDHLGSIESVTLFGSNDGTLAADGASKPSKFSEDAWGSRRNPSSWTGAPTSTDDGGADSAVPRGYTGHEMLDDLGLVHMNGRIYDSLFGRFLSADILIPNATDLQSYNRYTYVLNRPLSLFDPTGWAPDGDASWYDKAFYWISGEWKVDAQKVVADTSNKVVKTVKDTKQSYDAFQRLPAPEKLKRVTETAVKVGAETAEISKVALPAITEGLVLETIDTANSLLPKHFDSLLGDLKDFTTAQADQAIIGNGGDPDHASRAFMTGVGRAGVYLTPMGLDAFAEKTAVLIEDKSAAFLASCGAAESGALRGLGSRGVRNTAALTDAQWAQVQTHIGELGLDSGNFLRSSSFSGYSDMLDKVFLGPNVFPTRSATLFERLNPRSVIAHEWGHKLIAPRGFAPGSLMDEVGASLAGRQLPGLTGAERFGLLRDAVERARAGGTSVRTLLGP